MLNYYKIILIITMFSVFYIMASEFSILLPYGKYNLEMF